MGGKGADDAADEAKRARNEEAARQARIRQGTGDINRIFSGGTGVTGQLAKGAVFDPTKKYYLADGTVWTPPAAVAAPAAAAAAPIRRSGGISSGREQFNKPGISGGAAGGGRSAGSNLGGRAGPSSGGGGTSEFDKLLAEGKLYSGAETTPGAFGEDFFNQRRQAFIDYATPQLESQRGDAARELTFALTRSGNLDSSSRATKEGELGKLYDLNRQDIADKGQEYANTARTSVEDARSDLIKTLNATGDAAGATSGAINRAAALSAPDTYSPLTQLFADFTAGLGTQAALERAEALSGRDYARHNTGLFRPGRVTGNA